MMTSEIVVSPANVCFTKDSISVTFKKPRNQERIDDAVDLINQGSLSPKAFPKLNVVMFHNHLWSLDNRRLWVFKKAEVRFITVTVVGYDFHPRFHAMVSSSPSLFATLSRKEFFPRVREQCRQTLTSDSPPPSKSPQVRPSDASTYLEQFTCEIPETPFPAKRPQMHRPTDSEDYHPEAYIMPYTPRKTWQRPSPPGCCASEDHDLGIAFPPKKKIWQSQIRSNCKHLSSEDPEDYMSYYPWKTHRKPSAPSNHFTSEGTDHHMPFPQKNAHRHPATHSKYFTSETSEHDMPIPPRKTLRQPPAQSKYVVTSEVVDHDNQCPSRKSHWQPTNSSDFISETLEVSCPPRKTHGQQQKSSIYFDSTTSAIPSRPGRPHFEATSPNVTFVRSKPISSDLPPLPEKVTKRPRDLSPQPVPTSKVSNLQSPATKKIKVYPRDPQKSKQLSSGKSSVSNPHENQNPSLMPSSKAAPSVPHKPRAPTRKVASKPKPFSYDFHSIQKKSKPPPPKISAKTDAAAKISTKSKQFNSDTSPSMETRHSPSRETPNILKPTVEADSSDLPSAPNFSKVASKNIQRTNQFESLSFDSPGAPTAPRTCRPRSCKMTSGACKEPRSSARIVKSSGKGVLKMGRTCPPPSPPSKKLKPALGKDSSTRSPPGGNFVSGGKDGRSVLQNGFDVTSSISELQVCPRSTESAVDGSSIGGEDFRNEQQIVAHSLPASRRAGSMEVLRTENSGHNLSTALQMTVHTQATAGSANRVQGIMHVTTRTRSGVRYKEIRSKSHERSCTSSAATKIVPYKAAATKIVPFNAATTKIVAFRPGKKKKGSFNLKSVKVGDQVFVNVQEIDESCTEQRLSITRNLSTYEAWRVMGPFRVIRQVNGFAARLQLPQGCTLRTIVSLTKLKKTLGPNDILIPPSSALVKRVAETILQKRVTKRWRKRKVFNYLVKWKGLPIEDATWESDAILNRHPHLLDLTDLPVFINPFLLRNLRA